MALNAFFRSVDGELALLTPSYPARRLEHPAFEPYPTIDSLLAATEPRVEGKKRYFRPESAAILCALLDRYQQTKGRLWGALLVRAFRPMMRHLARRLLGGTADDRESSLLVSFHAATLRVDPRRDPARIAMYVAQETRRGVFRELRRERDWREVGFGRDPDRCVDPATLERPERDDVGLLRRLPRGTTGATLAALGHEGPLSRLVRRHYASLSPKEQARVYRRLQQRRRRHRQQKCIRETPSRSALRSLPTSEVATTRTGTPTMNTTHHTQMYPESAPAGRFPSLPDPAIAVAMQSPRGAR
jgi:hypothetical protein